MGLFKDRRSADYPRMDSETTDGLRSQRFIPESSRSGMARQSRILSTPAADGGPLSSAVRERSGRAISEPPPRQKYTPDQEPSTKLFRRN